MSAPVSTVNKREPHVLCVLVFRGRTPPRVPRLEAEAVYSIQQSRGHPAQEWLSPGPSKQAILKIMQFKGHSEICPRCRGGHGCTRNCTAWGRLPEPLPRHRQRTPSWPRHRLPPTGVQPGSPPSPWRLLLRALWRRTREMRTLLGAIVLPRQARLHNSTSHLHAGKLQ